MHVKHAGATVVPDDGPGKVAQMVIAPWRRVGVFTGRGPSARFFVVAPSGEENRMNFGDLYVVGKFQIVQKINNAREASVAWKAFEPA